MRSDTRTRLDMFELQDNSEVYCWLKHELEPRYSVVSVPDAAYFSEWSYCYRVLEGTALIREFAGDFRQLQPGELVADASALVSQLHSDRQRPRPSASPEHYPIASRLPPDQSPTTWFGSGRAAFAWLVDEVIQPRRIHLPTLICWSLVNVLQTRFPQISMRFYPVNRHLQPCWPSDIEQNDALLFVNYFGYQSSPPVGSEQATLIEDCSHLPRSSTPMTDGYAFGSVRKVYNTADGGYLNGRFNPVYEPDRKLDAWLRHEATDWRDLREAEHMTDRHWSMSDISSQSLTAVLSADEIDIGIRRRANESLLAASLSVGDPVRSYGESECPLLHNRYLPTTAERDSLRRFLADNEIYCSIHWPVHPLVMQRQDHVDITETVWMQDHVLSIPVSQNYGLAEMEAICTACDEWSRAGSARFGTSAA